MNGLKKISVLCCVLSLISCQRHHVKENEGEALFLLYKGVPQRIDANVSYWYSTGEFLRKEQKHIPNNKLQLLELFDNEYAVVRLGDFKIAYEVEKMHYQNAGERLVITLTNGNNNMGYPIFIQRKSIKQISIQTNNIEIYFTNLP